MSRERSTWSMDTAEQPPGGSSGGGSSGGGLPPDGPDKDLLQPGDRVDQFKVIRLLAKGGMGEVYLARDMTLGRRVAIKVIRRQSRLTDEAVERFLFEARATANLSHPNIVAIFYSGQHQGLPYVVMEYLEGGNLRARLLQDPPGPKEAIRLALAVARALADAHAGQIVHRDLKPENLLIPPDGRLRVVDFGLARVMDRPLDQQSSEDLTRALSTVDQFRLDAPPTVNGSPPYMAPEQWLQGDSSGATDIWALGIVIHEMLTGERPYEHFTFIELAAQVAGEEPVPLPLEGQPGHPAALVELVRACLNKEAKERPTAAEVVETLEALLQRGSSRLDIDAPPFRGLAPFGEEHAELFFGRDAELLEFLEKLRHQAVLPVVGPSGAGKSSFVQAGVIPRLRERGGWTVLRMRPGEDPFRALAARLAAGETRAGPMPALSLDSSAPGQKRTGDTSQEVLSGFQTLETTLAEEEALASELRDKPHMLSLALRRLAAQQEGKVLLLVDQLEELHTLTTDPEHRRAFMEAICGAADEASDPVRVIFTLREDFLSRMSLGPLVRVVMGQLTVMHRPEPRALRQTLTYPLETLGFRFDDDLLATRMVDEVEGERAALPLLQFAARRLWDQRDRDGKVLRLADFNAMGGVAGALANHADGVVDNLEPAEQEAAREMLMRLVTSERTRQVVERGALLEGLGQEGEAVLQNLVAARLLTSRRGAGAAGGIELVHESLIHTWRRLARWLEESREDLVFLEEAGRAARLWTNRGRRDAEVWTGQALLEAEAAMARCSAKVPVRIRSFIEAGQRRRDRTTWRLRWLGLALLVVVSLTAAFFYLQRREAVQQREVAEAQRALADKQRQVARERLAESLVEGSRAALAQNKRMEASARLRTALRITDSITARGLWWRLTRNPLVWTRNLGDIGWDLAFSPDGKKVAAASQNGTVYLMDVKTRAQTALRGFNSTLFSLAFSPGGQALAVGTGEGQIHLRDLSGGTERLLLGHKQAVWALAFSSDGKLLASGSRDNTVRLHPLGASPRKPLVLQAGARGITAVAISPDGKQVAASSNDGFIYIWRASDGRQLKRIQGHEGGVSDLSYNHDGTVLASVGGDRITALWDMRSGLRKAAFTDHGENVKCVAFSPDGKLLATGARDNIVRLWDLARGTLIRRLQGHADWIRRVRFSPDGHHLASTGYKNTVRLWRTGSGSLSRPPGGHKDSVLGVKISPDGTLVVSASSDGTMRIWDRPSGRLLKVISLGGGRNPLIDISADGKLLAVVNRQVGARLYKLPEGVAVENLAQDLPSLYGVAFHPDGRHLAVSGEGQVWLLNTRTSKAAWTVKSARTATTLRFNRQGTMLAGSLWTESVAVWDARTGQTLHELKGHNGFVYGLGFSHDGATLHTMGIDRTIRSWPMAGGPGAVTTTLDASAHYGDISPDGKIMGVPLADATTHLLQLDGRPLRTLVGHRADVNAVAFASGPDMPWLATSSDDQSVRLWDSRDGTSLWHTILLAPTVDGVLTRGGWERLSKNGGALPSRVSKQYWSRAAMNEGHLGAISTDGALLCLVTRGGKLQLWDLARDRQLFTAEVGAVKQVEAPGVGCLVLASREARLYRKDGSFHKLSSVASAVATDSQGVLVLENDKVRTFTLDGKPGTVVKVGVDASAVGRVEGWLVVGYQEGLLERFHLDSKGGATPAPLSGTSASAVERIAQGPRGTLVVGHAQGEVGIWDVTTGNLLHTAHLHGPVTHISMHQHKLHLASELGEHQTLDLTIFDRPYKDLRAEVEKKVPMIWKDGRVQLAD